jgi:hypothetical protein
VELSTFCYFYIKKNIFKKMERNEIINILNGMCERCLIKGLIQSLDDARKLYDAFDRFRNNGYVRDDEYSDDILYFYNLATELHKSGNTSLEESYSIYNAILSADRIEYVETNYKEKRSKK